MQALQATSYLKGVTWPLWFHIGISKAAYDAASDDAWPPNAMPEVHQKEWQAREIECSGHYQRARQAADTKGFTSKKERDDFISTEMRKQRIANNPFIKKMKLRNALQAKLKRLTPSRP